MFADFLLIFQKNLENCGICVIMYNSLKYAVLCDGIYIHKERKISDER